MELPAALGPVLDRLPLGPSTPTVLEIDLTRGLLGSSPSSPLDALRHRQVPRLSAVVDALREAADDDAVAGLVLRMADDVPIAYAEELGAAVEAFGSTGRPTIATAATFGELTGATVAYLLASHADEIWVQPSGSVGLVGVSFQVRTVGEALERIGTVPQMSRRHEYKSAAELITGHGPSDENLEMTQRLADSVLETVVATVARRRGLTVEAVREAVTASPLTAAQALERGLVDRIGYRHEADHALRERLGVVRASPGSGPGSGSGSKSDHEPRVRLRYAHRHAASRPSPAALLRRQRRVAVVSVTGPITTGRSGGSPLGGSGTGSDTAVAVLRAVRDDDRVDGVVLRVDSPGGSYVASDAIRAAILDLRASGRPVVASMGTVAASGGYFVAMPADLVVASPTTLTGSIGVLAGKVATGPALRRLGVTTDAVGAGERATMFSTATPFDDAHWQALETWLDAVYADFTTKAATDRQMPIAQLEPLARGRVWTGADARQRGLVDELGGLSSAVDHVARLIGRGRADLEVAAYPQVQPWQRLMPAESSESPADARIGATPDTPLTLLTRMLGLPVGAGVLTAPVLPVGR